MKYQTVDDDDPRRCQGQHQHGQCRNKSVDGLDKCPLHAGRSSWLDKRRKVRNYNLAVYQARLDELGEAPAIMSLREEVAILRMLLERRLNACKSEAEFLGAANKVGDLVLRIESVVRSCRRIEAIGEQTLSWHDLLAMCGKILEVIAEHVEDGETLARIGDRLV
jgi:hypothetical protein